MPPLPANATVIMSVVGESAMGMEGNNTADNDEVAALRMIVEGTARVTGADFFHSLAKHLAQAVGVKYAFVAEFAGEMRARTLAYWTTDKIAENVEWDLRGTPCEEVVRGGFCHHPTGVSESFPQDKPLVDMGIQSYMGVPLVDARGVSLGHLAVFDDRPMPADSRRFFIFRIFAARAAAELERVRAEKELADSEQRFRDLYDEAPIAYVLEDLESRFVSANRAAMRILGVKPEEVKGMVGISLVPNTPDAQKRVRQAFESIGRGTDTSGVVLELRRKDNGKPVWVQWWSKPVPGTKHTRTMFVDITDRMLLEQERARLQAQNLYLQEEIKSTHNFDEIVGQSEGLRAVLDGVRRVAPTDATVLVLGETGTGKELFARAIHSNSPRKDRPLIKVNCAALPTGLVESELFGHERGAFSGAITRRVGRFELANGGTIFLDEVGEVPLEVQAKLLRVLQEREFERVGGGVPIKTDVRIIAATNRDLLKAVRAGTFREDLYYRLNVFPIQLPPLRDRKEDIPMLVQFLVGKMRVRIGKSIEGVEKATMDRLVNYLWPGNVRELENVLERAIILSGGPVLEVREDLLTMSDTAKAPGGTGAALDSKVERGNTDVTRSAPSLESVERNHILDVLEQTGWVIDGPRGAGKILEMHPNTLRSRLKKLGISRKAK